MSMMITSVLSLNAQKVTLDYQNQKLESIMRGIRKQTGLKFAYSPQLIDVETVMSIHANNEELETLLNRLFSGRNIGYERREKDIFLFPANANEKTTHDSQNADSVRLIHGQVSDLHGEPMIGVTVQEEGSGNGCVTDGNGYFRFSANHNANILISYIGYSDVRKKASADFSKVILQEDTKTLDEVVVVGYGSKRRRDLVGSVEQISNEKIGTRANMNVTRSLQGMIPGLNISVSDGKPSSTPNLNLRGSGSIGAGGSALILIDGIEGSLNSVNPADIESVSVLKDASSASIYGARGAFGVILVTTKDAKKGKSKVSYNGSFSLHQRLNEAEIVNNGLQWTDGWYSSYMEGKDTGTPPGGINNVFKYSTEWYNELVKRNDDPSLDKVRVNEKGEYEYFGNTNWFDIIYKDIIPSTEHNISVSGGNDRAQLYVSGRYFNQDGVYSAGNEDYTQYNMRLKGTIQINDMLSLSSNTDFGNNLSHQPMVMYDNQNILRQIEHQGYPMTMEKNPDGTWTEAAVYTGWAGFVEGTSYMKQNKLELRNTTTLAFEPIREELIFKADYSYYTSRSERKKVENQYEFYTGPAIKKTRNTYSSLENRNYNQAYHSANITANYIPKFRNDDHSLNLLLGGNLEQKNYSMIQSYRRGLLNEYKPSFALMDGDYYTIGQSGYEWAYLGMLYRINYNYKGRYLAELSGRYDGTSKFPTNEQWGFFPSVSAAWRLSEEHFMAPSAQWLSNMKVRMSVGSLGNGNVDPYVYLSTVPISKTSALINGSLQTAAYVPKLIPNNLTWETATTYDLGLDIDLFHNQLSIVFDYYQRYTTNMYTEGMVKPAVIGADVPKGNNADMKTKGWELAVEWRDQFNVAGKPFSYGIKGMVWDSRSWITKYNNPTKLLSNYYEGMELGEIWGYHVEGLFADQADIDAHADQSKIKVSDTNILKPGDIKFSDLNADGKIETGKNTLEDHGDLKKIGNTSARYNYGINLNANWNGFGLSAFFQGIGKKNWYPSRESGLFWGQYNRPYGYMLQIHTGDNVWSETNQNENAYWPRYRGYIANSASKSMGVINDRYLQNVGYIRLKNVQLDYSFNQNICKKLHMENLRIYVSGENLFTWSPMFRVTRNFDPEVITPGDADFRSTKNSDGDGYSYPMLNSYTFGINVTF